MSKKQDLDFLENCYMRASNDIVVVYGNKYTDIHGLLNNFQKDKESFLYEAKYCDITTQFKLFIKDFQEQNKKLSKDSLDFKTNIEEYIESSDKKKVIIFNEFVHFFKKNDTFISLLSSIRSSFPAGKVLFILASTDVFWIENVMVSKIKKSSYEISGLKKVTPYSISELRNKYRNIDIADFIALYSVLGGCGDFWLHVSDNTNIKDFMIEHVLRTNSFIFQCGYKIIPDDLREPAIYNTLLYYLASGTNKLNDLYKVTGYERAKISVYLKNLAQRGLIKKSELVGIGGENCVKKGVYYICEPYVHFYYRFIFPNISGISVLTPENFYKKYIDQQFNAYLELFYMNICFEQIKYLDQKNKLPFKLVDIVPYNDKTDSIDFIITGDTGYIVCGVRYASPHMAYNKLEGIINTCKKAKFNPKAVYLFSASGFDQKLQIFSHVNTDVVLFEQTDHRLR